VNLSACLAKLGKSVLLIDADPQAATTSGLGFQRAERTIYDVLLGRCSGARARRCKGQGIQACKGYFRDQKGLPDNRHSAVSALLASDAVLIPVQAEYYPLEGLAHLLRFLKTLESRLGRGLRKMVLITMFDSRLKICREVEKQLRSFLKDSVLKTVIPRNVRLAEAPSHGKPVILYDPSCLGARAYMRLAEEVISIAERK
jgi:chromosome partitioning protein